MKVYVFGQDKDACIELANQLNEKGAAALIAKETEGLKDVAARIGKAFDRAVMVSADPIRDSVIANRDTRVRAAICYNQKTLKAAANAEINLFILESDAHERLDISDILGNPSPKQAQPVQKTKEVPTPLSKKVDQKKQSQPAPAAPSAPKPRPDDDSPRSGGGVGSRLKDIFGIEE